MALFLKRQVLVIGYDKCSGHKFRNYPELTTCSSAAHERLHLLRESRNAFSFTKPNSSLPFSKQTSNGTCFKPLDSISQPIYLRSISVSSFHPGLYLPRCLFLPVSPTKNPDAILLTLKRSTCPTHLILLGFVTLTISGKGIMKFLIMQFNYC